MTGRLLPRRLLSCCLFVTLLLLAPAICRAAAQPAAEVSQLVPLGAGDVVSVDVFGQPDLSVTGFVAADGTVKVPLVGAIKVAGLSPAAAARQIEQAFYRDQYLKDPRVNVTVTQSSHQDVAVLGEVRTPGRYHINLNATVLDLLAEAGGVTEDSGDVIYVLRPGADGTVVRQQLNIRDAGSIAVTSGDSISVPRAHFFYIDGQVNKPDRYRLEDGMTVLQAITLAGGITAKGSERRVEIKRLAAMSSRDKRARYITIHARASDAVQPDDVIHVKESIF